MRLDQIEALRNLGVNYDETMERFMENENLYIKCLGKYLCDDNYELFLKAMEQKDVRQSFEASHALKGVSANLGFNILYEKLKVIVEVFRAGSFDYDPDNLEAIKEAYKDTIETVKKIVM